MITFLVENWLWLSIGMVLWFFVVRPSLRSRERKKNTSEVRKLQPELDKLLVRFQIFDLGGHELHANDYRALATALGIYLRDNRKERDIFLKSQRSHGSIVAAADNSEKENALMRTMVFEFLKKSRAMKVALMYDQIDLKSVLPGVAEHRDGYF